MKYAPVILFTYARPIHTRQVLDALAKNSLADKSRLFIFCDGAKGKKDFENNARVKELIIEEQQKHRFLDVIVNISNVNNGLAKSIITGASSVIQKYGRCIVIEDDVITGKFFLSFMNECLDFYKDDSKIFAISGFTYDLPAFKNYHHDVYLSYRACSCAWATWKDRWELVDWEVKDYKEFSQSHDRIKKFNRGGNDLSRMLRHQMRGERNSWAIRWCYAQSKYDLYAVYPTKSLIKNIGYDETGTNCSNNSNFGYNIEYKESLEIHPSKITINSDIIKDFKNVYKINFIDIVDWLKKKAFKYLKKIFTR